MKTIRAYYLEYFYLVQLNYFFFIGTAWASKCERLSTLASLEDHGTVVETSLRLLQGSWLSESCETRPGPQYILRAYNFESDGRYHLVQHHYWDDSCSSPKLSIISYGRVLLRNSLVQPGASSGLIKVTNISIIPQDAKCAKDLDRQVNAECPGQYWKSWRKYEEQLVFSNRNDNFEWSNYEEKRYLVNSRANMQISNIACLGDLKYAFNELKLIKIQLRPLMDHQKKRPRQMKMELLLGDIHSNPEHRDSYYPTSFQTPLLKQSSETIFLNRHTYTIKNTNKLPSNLFTMMIGKTPPHLNEKPHLPPYIWGEWTSVRCEIRPMGLYLTRRFSFYAEDSTWIGEHRFFADPFCKIPKFIVTAAGHFLLDGSNKHLKATNIDFAIERASLTVLDERMIYEMRLPGLCGLDEWEVNVPKELSSTNGCMQLGIILPSTQKDIIKLEMDYHGSCLLYMGQVETDSLNRLSDKRPTSYQLPLIKCGEVPTYSEGLREILEENFNLESGSNRRNLSMFFVLNLILFLLIR